VADSFAQGSSGDLAQQVIGVSDVEERIAHLVGHREFHVLDALIRRTA
jgi:hypothetical protein